MAGSFGSLGSLVVSIEANVAQFTSDMGKMAYIAETGMKRISSAIGTTQSALKGLVAGFAIKEVVGFGVSLVEAADHLHDLSIRTGASVEALSAMRQIAKQSGTDIDAVAQTFDKLQKNALQAQSGTGAVAQAFRALGLGSKELADGLKNPDALFLKVAKSLAQFRDDGNKTAVVMELMGRSGDQLLPFLQQFAEDGYKNVTLTTEQAAKADELSDAWARLADNARAYGTDVLLAWLPALSKIQAGFILTGSYIIADWNEVGIALKDSFLIATRAVADSIDWLVQKAENGAKRIGNAFGGNFQLDTSDAFAGTDKLKKDLSDRIGEIQRIKDEAAKAYVEATTQVAVSAKTTPNRGSLTGAVDHSAEMRRAINEQIKALNDGIKAIEAAWKVHDGVLDRLYAQSEISLSDYGDSKIALMESSFAATQAIYDQEIAALQQYIKTVGDKEKIAEATGKLEQARAQKAEDLTREEAAREAVTRDLIGASNDYAASLMQVDEAYALLMNDTETYTRLQLAQQNAALRSILIANRDYEALKKLDAVEANLVLRSKQDWLSGLRVGVQDWVKQAQNIAQHTQSLVTNFLDGMTDALVQFVQTGKVNFKSLINSMIADLARLIIEQQLAGLATSIAGAFAGGAGVSVTGDSSVATSMGMFATGGSFTVGGSGGTDKTPVSFMATRGEVVNVSHGPQSSQGGGAPSLVYAPVINVDSRADRQQVQEDTARIVRQGNKEMILWLQRNNPGLRA